MRASIQLKPQTKIYRTRAGTHTRTHHTHHIHTIHHSHTHTPGKHFALDSLVSPEDKHAVGDLSSQRQPVHTHTNTHTCTCPFAPIKFDRVTHRLAQTRIGFRV
jgi:hypothetical protein